MAVNIGFSVYYMAGTVLIPTEPHKVGTIKTPFHI